ncbi:MAG: hypothetical protein JWL71_532 [Acidobacteria bacterium]|nr:hypothetical protein [Acidobacteriota bacterium]
MRNTMTTIIAVATLAVGLAAQHGKTDPPAVTGTWNMGLQGGHVIPVALVLNQDGGALTGTISMPTQRIGQIVDVALKGEIAGGVFTLSGSVEGASDPTTIEITGSLTDEGMLEGRVVMSGAQGPHGDMPYTAERLKVRK